MVQALWHTLEGVVSALAKVANLIRAIALIGQPSPEGDGADFRRWGSMDEMELELSPDTQ